MGNFYTKGSLDAGEEGILTPKLVLWWVPMLTKNEVSVRNCPAPLDSWKIKVATGISKKEPPPSAHINQLELSKDQQTAPAGKLGGCARVDDTESAGG
jgi:hypothetical protein